MRLRSRHETASSTIEARPLTAQISDAMAKGSSDEDDEGIPPASTPKRSSKKSGATKPVGPGRQLRSRKGGNEDGIFEKLPSRKRRRGAMEIREESPKHRRTNNGTRADANEPDEYEIEVAEIEVAGEEDDGSNVELNLEQERDHEPDDAQEDGHEENEAPAVPGNDGGEQQERPRSSSNAEMALGYQSRMTSTQTTKQSRATPRQARRRQSRKISFQEPGYQAPRGASPDLGTDLARTTGRKEQRRATSSRRGSKKSRRGRKERERDEGHETDESEQADDDIPEAFEGSIAEGEEAGYDETIFIEPPEETENDEPITIKLERKHLDTILSHMGKKGWTNETNWSVELLRGKDEEEEAWLNRQRPYLKRTRALFKNLDTLRSLCHETPKFPDVGNQSQYLRQHSDEFGKSMSTIRKSVEKVSSRITAQLDTSTHDEESHKEVIRLIRALTKKIIPMLVLLLKEVFMLGGVTNNNGVISPLATCEFTLSSLQFVLRVTGWTKRLYGLMRAFSEAYPPKPTQSDRKKDFLRKSEKFRGWVEVPLKQMIKDADTALDQLHRQLNAPLHRKEAEEKDRAVRIQREKRERERIDAEDRQMQLFIESMQRKSMKRHESQVSSTLLRSTASHPVRAEVLDPRPPAPSHRAPRRRKDAYFQKNGKWYYWEDSLLLDMIRKVLKPNIQVLKESFTHRSVREVEDRIGVLKDRVRARYEAAGTDPPLWCYRHE